MVVKEFRPAIPESGLVFVAFQNKFCAAAEAVALTEILRYSADQEIRVLACSLEKPRQHGCSGGFPVRTANHNGMSSRQEYFFQNFRHGTVRNFAIEHFLQLRIAPGNDISNNRQVRSRRQIRGVKRMKERNAQTFEQRGSRRIHSRIRTGDAKAAL